MSFSYIMLRHVVPAVGSVVSIAMYLAPIKSVINAGQTRQLGDLNALPIAMTLLGSILWTVYGFIAHDYYVGIPTIVGIIVATYEVSTCLSLMDDAKDVRKVQAALVAGASILPTIGAISVFLLNSTRASLTMWGIAANVCSCLYYAAPLSTMAAVIKTRNSSSILLPMTVMNIMNTLMWLTYGVAINALLIWMPNTIGLTLSLSQVVLRLLYSAKKPAIKLEEIYFEGKKEGSKHVADLAHNMAPASEHDSLLHAASLVDGALVHVTVHRMRSRGDVPALQAMEIDPSTLQLVTRSE